MAVVSDVEIRLRADIARLQADMDAARRTVGSTMDRISSAVDGARKAFIALSLATGIGAIIAMVSGLKSLIGSTIEATGSLSDLSIQTGASVAALMKFKEIGATSDTTAEALAGAMNKLAKGMAVANEESKGLPQAVAAIGLKFNDLRKLNPEDQMLAIAKALDGFANGAGKSAVAMALYGKEGAKLLPFLADLASEADNVAAALTDQEKVAKKALANMADNYGDNLTKIQLVSQQTGKAIAEGMLPALYEASQAFLNVVTEASGMRDAVKRLAADGSIAEWTRNGITVLSYLADAFQVVGRLVSGVTTIVLGSLKTMYTFISGSGSALKSIIEGEYKTAFETIKTTMSDTLGVVKDAGKSLGENFTEDTFGKKLRAQLQLVKDVKAEAEEVKKQVDYKPPPETNKELEKQIKAFNDLTAAMKTHVEETAREAAGLPAYNAAQKEDVKLTEELAAGKRKLSAEQEAQIRGYIKQWNTNLQVIETLEKSKKAAEDMSKIEQKLTDDRAAAVKKASDEADANEELVATFGMTKTAIEQLELARLKEQLAQRGSVGMTADEITQLENLIALKERSAKAVADVDAMNQTKEFWTSIEKTAHDTFVSIADGGKNAWTRLKDSAKNIFFDWLYQMTIKKWFINIGTSVSGGSDVSALTGGSGSTSSPLGLFSAGKSLFDGFSTGFDKMGTDIAGYVQKGMDLYNGTTSASAGSTATSIGGFASTAGAFALAAQIGMAIGDKISGGFGVTGNSKAFVNWMTLLSPVPILGGALGGLVNRAFGMKDKQYGDSTLSGTLSGSGFAGDISTAWTQKGGWFRSDKAGVDKAAVDSALAATLGTAYESITSASAQYAKALGLNADAIATRSQALNIAFGKDDAANQKAIEEFFVTVGNNIAQELLPNIADFAAEGESASTTLQRLTLNFQAVDAMLQAMGTTSSKAFGDTGAAAIAAREKLIALAGGLQNLATQMQYISDNFITQDAKMEMARRQVTETMSVIAGLLSMFGYSAPKSIQDYSYIVQDLTTSNALATDAGRQLYATLLALAPAFKAVTDYATEMKAAANDRASAALDALGKAVDAQKNIVTAAYDKAMTAIQTRIDSLSDSIGTLTNLSSVLKGALAGVDTPGAVSASRAVAAADVQAALAIARASGVLPSADSLSAALATLKANSSDQFATLAEYQRSVAQSNAAIEALGGLTDGQLSVAEQQLAALTAQRDALTAANVAELARLDSLVSAAQAQINAVNGLNTSVLTIGQALVNLYYATGVLAGYTGISATTVAPGAAPAGVIDTNALLTEMRVLNERIASMEAAAARTAASTEQFAGQFNQVSAGGNSLVVEMA